MQIMAPAKLHPSVRYILPSGTPSPTLKMAQSEASAWEASKVLGIFRDDQALATMRRPRARGRDTGTSLFHSALLDSLLPHDFRHRFTPPVPSSLFLTHSAQRLARFDTSVERDDTTSSPIPHTPELRLCAGF